MGAKMFYSKREMEEERRDGWWEGWILGALSGAGLMFLIFVGYGAYLEYYYPN